MLGLLISFSCFAGHETGVFVLTYENVGAITGNPLSYVVSVSEVYDTQILTPPSSVSIDLTSSCYPTTQITLPKLANTTYISGSYYCLASGAANYHYHRVLYQDTIVLPGTCAQFNLVHTGSFSRYGYFSNLSTTGAGNPYFSTLLNNSQGPNSSPTTDFAEAFKKICINKPVTLFSFDEPDGDSIYYSPSVPSRITGTTISNYSYVSGYSTANPVGSTVGYSLNPATGQVQTTFTSQGSFFITVKYEEYRLDTALGVKVKIGEGKFIFDIASFATACNTDPFQLQHLGMPGSDSLNCGQQVLKFSSTRRLESSSLSSSGSEFSVVTSWGNVPVISASIISDSVVELQLGQAIPGSSSVMVYADTGSDGDVLMSVCGRDLAAFQDTLIFYTKGAGAPAASFSYSNTWLQASFNSSGSVADSLVWDFGDGSPASTQAHPSHKYSSAGSYTVQLIAWNDCGVSDTFVVNLQVCDTLKAGFNISQVGDSIFVDAGSSSGASQYFWQFGDGSSQAGLTAGHRYSQSGSYLVQLIAVNACGDSLNVSDSVQLCAAPMADWTYNIVSTGGSGMVVDFDGSASQNAQRFVWDFGDGTKDSSSLTPTHTYATPSLQYLVSLSIFNGCNQLSVRQFRLDQIGLTEVARSSVQLYPNPAADILIIEWEEELSADVEFCVYSLSGNKLVCCSPDEGQRQQRLKLNVGSLPVGSYILRLEGERTFTKVFAIKR